MCMCVCACVYGMCFILFTRISILIMILERMGGAGKDGAGEGGGWC